MIDESRSTFVRKKRIKNYAMHQTDAWMIKTGVLERRAFFRVYTAARARARACKRARDHTLADPTAFRVGVESCYCAGIWFYINSCTLCAGGRASVATRVSTE